MMKYLSESIQAVGIVGVGFVAVIAVQMNEALAEHNEKAQAHPALSQDVAVHEQRVADLTKYFDDAIQRQEARDTRTTEKFDRLDIKFDSMNGKLDRVVTAVVANISEGPE